MVDKSLTVLRVIYECQTAGALNYEFDRAMQNLAARFGLEFWASGMDMTSGERDLSYDRWPEQDAPALPFAPPAATSISLAVLKGTSGGMNSAREYTHETPRYVRGTEA